MAIVVISNYSDFDMPVVSEVYENPYLSYHQFKLTLAELDVSESNITYDILESLGFKKVKYHHAVI